MQAIHKAVYAHNDAQQQRYEELLQSSYNMLNSKQQSSKEIGPDSNDASRPGKDEQTYWEPPPQPTPLLVGGDELQPLFIYVVLFSGCTDLYACMDFIEHCAHLEWRCDADGQVRAHALQAEASLPGQAGHLVAVMRIALEVLQALARRLANTPHQVRV